MNEGSQRRRQPSPAQPSPVACSGTATGAGNFRALDGKRQRPVPASGSCSQQTHVRTQYVGPAVRWAANQLAVDLGLCRPLYLSARLPTCRFPDAAVYERRTAFLRFVTCR